MRIIDADALFDSLIFPNDQWGKTFKELLDDEPTVDLNKCFEGMTNGEVIQALFPDGQVISVDSGVIEYVTAQANIMVSLDFWNSPYQKGGE